MLRAIQHTQLVIRILVVLTGKQLKEIQATGFVAVLLQQLLPVVAPLLAVEIIQQVELVTVLLLTCLILVVLVETHLKQVFVEATTQAHNIADIFTEVTEALELMEVVRPELGTLLCTHIQKIVAITLLMERAQE